MTLRIAVDVKSLMDRPTGIGRFTAQIVRSLLRVDEHRVVAYAYGGTRPSAELEALLALPRVRLVRHPVPTRIVRRAWRALGAPSLDRLTGDVDVVVAAETTMPATSRRTIAMIYDVLALDHPEWFNAYTRRAVPENLDDVAGARALAVMCETSRQAVARWRPAYASRLRILPPLSPSPRPRDAREDGYVLFVGTLEPRKGLGILARALLIATGAAARLRLIVAGRVGWGDMPGREALDVLHAEGRVDVLDYVDDERLAVLRARATLCAVPSFDEGFGLPVLESFAAAAPTIASDVPVFREVAAGAARLATAGDARAWADALDELAASAPERARLSAAGAARALAYSERAQDDAVRALLEEAVA